MPPVSRRAFAAGLAGTVLTTVGAGHSAAQSGSRVTLYMGPPEATCEALVRAFESATGIRATNRRLSAGAAIERVRAERAAPLASAIYGIGLPSLLTLKAEGLLEAYRPATAAEIPSRYRDPEGFWTGTDIDFLAFASNRRFLAERRLRAPSSWEDLIRPEFAGQICVGSPATSGTGYTFLTTVLQVMGETRGWDYLRRANANVAQFTRSGVDPVRLVGSGELGVGILFAHDILGAIRKGMPIDISLPQEGTGYDMFCAALIAGAPDAQAGRRFLDWACTPGSMEILAESGYFDVPTHPRAKLHDLVEPFRSARMIDSDFAWAGSPDTRRALVDRFRKDILTGRT